MIKVLVPDLPTADELLPYLREIDERHIAVNQGPLVRRLEDELWPLVGNPCRVVANGTVSLELALRALNLPRGSQVLVPAVTYVATGQAVVNAGLQPVLCDVDADSWQLTPKIAAEALPSCPKLRAVIPVATYGAPVPLQPWEQFSQETTLPILVDAAGAIYGQQSSASPDIIVSYSLHATKALGAGEGGVVATANTSILERVEELATFGPGGTNAKMSEYHAAVGLASIARPEPSWVANVFRWYAQMNPPGVELQSGTFCRPTLWPVLVPDRVRKGLLSPAVSAQVSMACAGIETKQWYRPFLDEREQFRGCQRIGDLAVTKMLRERCIGLPFHRFLTADDVTRVCEALKEIIG